jgi:hypothetical protein
MTQLQRTQRDGLRSLFRNRLDRDRTETQAHGKVNLKTWQFDYQPGNAKSTSLFATTATSINLP